MHLVPCPTAPDRAAVRSGMRACRLFVIAACFAFPAVALAQDAPPDGAIEPAAPTTGPAAASPATGETPAPEAAPEAEPEAAPEAEAFTATATNPFPGLTLLAFVDAYMAVHWTLPHPLSRDHSEALGHRAFDVIGGPTLSFVGLDVTYAPEPVGATVGLRYGASLPQHMGVASSGLPEGLQFISTAFASWKPTEDLQLDFGEFPTFVGAELSESWLDPNYTRGAVYYLLQPLYHTGLRATWSATPTLTVTAIAVNGWNSFIDNNGGKTFGAMVAWSDEPWSLSLGYIGGPELDGDNSHLRHLVDFIGSYDDGTFSLTTNVDVVTEDAPDGASTQWGAMLTGRWALCEQFALALRGEYLGDVQAHTRLATGTLTLDYQPHPALVIRLDTRADYSSEAEFPAPSGRLVDYVWSSVLGVVVHTN